MRKPLAALLAFLIASAPASAGLDPSNTFKMGDGTNSNKQIIFDRGAGALNPRFIWDSAVSKLKFTNDNTIVREIGSGSGGGQGIQLITDNPDFEGTLANWSASSAPTFTLASSGANLLFGAGSGVFTATGVSQTITGGAVTVPNGLRLTSGVGSCTFLTSATVYKVQVIQSGTVLGEAAIPASTVPVTVPAPFLVPASGNLQLRVISSGAGASLAMDNCFLGQSTISQIAQATVLGSAKWPATASCSWASSSGSYASFSADSDCTFPAGANLTGTALAPATKIPAFKFASIPPGEYLVKAIGAFANTGATSGDVSFKFFDGTTYWTGENRIYDANAAQISVPVIEGRITYLTPQSNVTIEVQGKVLGGAVQVATSADVNDLTLILMKYPGDLEQGVKADQLNPFVDAYIADAGNFTLATSGTVTKTEITDAGGSITANPGSQSVQIPCSTTNPSTGTTCAAGNEGLGVVFNVPQAGIWTACVDFSQSQGYSAGSQVAQNFYLVETPNNAQTVLQGGDFSIDTSKSVPSTGTWSFANSFCKDFNFTSAGQKTLRLFYSQAITGTVTQNLILTDQSADRQFHIKAYPKNAQTPTPVFSNMVTSSSSAVERINRARFVNNGATCTIGSQNGNWIQSVSRTATGVCSIVFAPGAFSGDPDCTGTGADAGSGAILMHQNSSSFPTTAGWAPIVIGHAGAAQDVNFGIICMGPK